MVTIAVARLHLSSVFGGFVEAVALAEKEDFCHTVCVVDRQRFGVMVGATGVHVDVGA